MGVHHGTVSRRRDPVSDRYQYFGDAVKVATELTLRAEGGHVLLSAAVISARVRMVQGIALGLAYLHSQQPAPILHRDLKSSNVLIDEAWNAKLADFGLARIKQENATMTRCGRPAWTAPEVVKRERYTEQADVYSLGVVMWEVATRKLPFAGENLAKAAMVVIFSRASAFGYPPTRPRPT
jgi:serine/threonine protein kinase